MRHPKSVYLSRLDRLASLLEGDAANEKGLKFDLNVVGVIDDPSELLSCGTTGCAMGLAAMSGEFLAEGLSFKTEEKTWRAGKFITGVMCTVNGYRHHYVDAATKVFGISSAIAVYFFVPTEFPPHLRKGAAGELEVVRRIRDYLALVQEEGAAS